MSIEAVAPMARTFRRLAVAVAIVACLLGGPAQAEDFVAECQAFATAASDGKAPANADRICACIKGQLSDTEQANSLEVLQEIIDAGKAGKEPAEPAGDKKVALQKFMDSGDTCSGQKK